MLTSTYRPAVIYCFCKQANGLHSIFGSVNWICCKLSFALPRALIISVRGACKVVKTTCSIWGQSGTNWPPTHGSSNSCSCSCYCPFYSLSLAIYFFILTFSPLRV